MLSGSISHGALKSEDEHRRDICAVGRWFHERNFVAATDGNISLRLDPNCVLTSPTGVSKGMMSPTSWSSPIIQGTRSPGAGILLRNWRCTC